jgi:myo-inositol 2-dehydrogenase/D-chiro-inositol 1-dehydrogenase
MTKLRVAIIGAGVMGRGHAEFIRDFVGDAEVVAISDVDEIRRKSLASDLSGASDVQIFAQPQQMFEEVLIDALIIASPDQLHTEHLRLAMRHELRVLCEKPIATTLEDARAIAAEIRQYEAQTGSKRVHYGFMRRFDPSYLKLRNLIDSGEFGNPLFVRTITRNVSSTGITTEGLYTNIAVHDFDVWRWLSNSEWKSVETRYPRPSSLSPKGLIDPLVFTAQLENELLLVADIVANNNYGYDLRTEVVCEKGSLEIGTFGDVYTRANHFAGAPQGGPMVENWIPRFKDAYIAELKAWVSSIQTGEIHPDLADVEDALAATEACFLALNSLN